MSEQTASSQERREGAPLGAEYSREGAAGGATIYSSGIEGGIGRASGREGERKEGETSHAFAQSREGARAGEGVSREGGYTYSYEEARPEGAIGREEARGGEQLREGAREFREGE